MTFKTGDFHVSAGSKTLYMGYALQNFSHLAKISSQLISAVSNKVNNIGASEAYSDPKSLVCAPEFDLF